MERQPHNNLWAEKLLQVSMPDSAGAWSGMEALLDKEMPQRFWSDWRRWILLILLLLLLIGVCNCPGRGRFFHGAEITRTQTPTSPANPANSSGPPTTHAPARPATPPSPATESPVVSSASPSGPTTHAPARPAAPKSDPTIVASHHVHPGPVPPVVVTATHRFGDITQTNSPGRTQRPQKHTITRRTTSTHNNGPPDTDAPITNADTAAVNRSPTAPPLAKPTAHNDITRRDNPRKDSTHNDTAHKDSTHKKPPPPPKEPEQKEKDHGWVFGVGLNQFFPLGDQRGSTYNSNGLTGTLTDYLPVPMIRYYFNHKTYIQLEVQFNTPQPTAKNLVISQPVPDTSTTGGVFRQVSSSASIQQLYYFNIPLSIHFNPWDNLNIGTGFQWSHLSNAVGEFDSATSTSINGLLPTVVDAKSTHSFKGDALYQQIKTNELRFLLDANYTYKHFVLGLRYNQALSKFVNLQLPNGETTQGRNSSLQLYMRYILWDTRKKKAPAKTP